MKHLRLAYRDVDRLPVIWAIREMARRHYDLDVEVLQLKGTAEFEAALPDGACDVIIERLDYTYGLPLRGRNVTMFCAPLLISETELVVAPDVTDPAQLVGKRVALRQTGRPHASMLRLRAMGLEGRVETEIVPDSAVGRWAQWKKVLSGEAAATFISDLYLEPALQAGLKVLAAPQVPIVNLYAQGCLTSFAAANDALMRDYLKTNVHALAWLKLRRAEALELSRGALMEPMGIADPRQFERWFDAIVSPLQLKPYPTPEAVTNMYEVACSLFPGCEGLNPLATWDLHWLKQLDDEGFLDALAQQLRAT
jgi:hypothetical protein